MSAANITFHHVFLQLVSTAAGFLLILSGAMRTILTWLGKVVVVTRGCALIARKVWVWVVTTGMGNLRWIL